MLDVGTKTSLQPPAMPATGRRRLLPAGRRPCCAKGPPTPPPPPPPPSREEGSGRLLGVSRSLLVRSGAALFGLGFVDAGYSGDWSRIGAISKEAEDSLKLSAYIIVPFCLLIIFSVTEENKA